MYLLVQLDSRLARSLRRGGWMGDSRRQEVEEESLGRGGSGAGSPAPCPHHQRVKPHQQRSREEAASHVSTHSHLGAFASQTRGEARAGGPTAVQHDREGQK